MTSIIKYLAGKFYRPLLAKYLASTRYYTYRGIRLVIPPEVFHPGFFFSTKILLRYVERMGVKGIRLLELGAGNGLLSLYMAREGAQVTASDINQVAIDHLRKNACVNGLPVESVHSDLFQAITPQCFDVIAINPPYFKKAPVTLIDHAWYCGERGEYFERLFAKLSSYVHSHSKVLMILSDGCDLEMIGAHASAGGWQLRRVLVKRNWMEELYIMSVEPLASIPSSIAV